MKLPSYTKYTDKIEGGDSNYAFVRINPKYRYDKGLHLHEYEHVRQWYLLTFGVFALYAAVLGVFASLFLGDLLIHVGVLFACASIHKLTYNLVDRYKLYAESKAYAKQIQYEPTEQQKQYLDYFAKVLTETYDLKYNLSEVRASILKYIK